jgi:hypothetical protein
VKRICVLLLVALGAGCAAPTALAVDAPPAPRAQPVSSPTPAVVPPALQALEQKLAQIRFNSLSFSTRVDLAVPSATATNGISITAASTHHIVISTTGVLSLSPQLLSSTSTSEGFDPAEAVGGTLAQERRIGASIYRYDPSVARRDGGRPWIRSTRSRSAEELAAKLAPLSDVFSPLLGGLEGPKVIPTELFAPLQDDLDQAQSIREAGSATVDGQPTLAFTLTFSPAKLFKQVPSEERRRLAKPRKRRSTRSAALTVELWLTPNGLPLQTLTTYDAHGEGFTAQEDILGLEVPVLVHAPPGDQTIDQARLIEIERRRAKAIGRCIRRHPRRLQSCIKRGVG